MAKKQSRKKPNKKKKRVFKIGDIIVNKVDTNSPSYRIDKIDLISDEYGHLLYRLFICHNVDNPDEKGIRISEEYAGRVLHKMDMDSIPIVKITRKYT